MPLDVKKKLAPFAEYLTESTTACLITMVQGNFLALTVGHLLIASQTGVIAGAIAAVTLTVAKTDRRWIVSIVLGMSTGVVDYFVHPGMFGTIVTEAVVTGIAAALLSYVAGTVARRIRSRRAQIQSQ